YTRIYLLFIIEMKISGNCQRHPCNLQRQTRHLKPALLHRHIICLCPRLYLLPRHYLKYHLGTAHSPAWSAASNCTNTLKPWTVVRMSKRFILKCTTICSVVRVAAWYCSICSDRRRKLAVNIVDGLCAILSAPLAGS